MTSVWRGVTEGEGEVVLGHLRTVIVVAEDAAFLASVHPLPDVPEVGVVPSPLIGSRHLGGLATSWFSAIHCCHTGGLAAIAPSPERLHELIT